VSQATCPRQNCRHIDGKSPLLLVLKVFHPQQLRQPLFPAHPSLEHSTAMSSRSKHRNFRQHLREISPKGIHSCALPFDQWILAEKGAELRDQTRVSGEKDIRAVFPCPSPLSCEPATRPDSRIAKTGMTQPSRLNIFAQTRSQGSSRPFLCGGLGCAEKLW
jgi:hypothetical protein